MEGTIEVERIMDYRARQRRQLEWLYLKEYWRAEKDDKPRVFGLYGDILRQALERFYKAK